MSEYEDHVHYPRFTQTMAGLTGALGNWRARSREILICETGDLSLISKFFIQQGYRVQGTSSDLRYSIDLPDGVADLVFSFEVIEHIQDQAPGGFDDLIRFSGSGATKYVSELYRILKPGGVLVLTTPNPCGLRALLQIIDFKPPMIYRDHIREYSKEELIILFEDFDLVAYRTYYSYFFLEDGPQMAKEWAERMGWNPDGRGDCHFALLRKPARPPREAVAPGP
jgi:SAM-dependent methyltransferase